jgi:hypothetical protein
MVSREEDTERELGIVFQEMKAGDRNTLGMDQKWMLRRGGGFPKEGGAW